MSIVKRVDKAPEKLDKTEMVINKPDLQKELDATRGKRGISKRTTAACLRDIFMAINDNYETQINPFMLKLSKYEGLVIETDDQIRAIISKIASDNDLPITEKIIEHSLKFRKPEITTIYYVSNDMSGLGAFIKFGFNQEVAQIKKKNEVKE